jgi:hypothetical protein
VLGRLPADEIAHPLDVVPADRPEATEEQALDRV